jgi:HD-GYP domain-containing protein (c-di-GMP phosphodiesterase class II)
LFKPGSYRQAMRVDEAIETMQADEGHFDPDLFGVFVDERSAFEAILGNLS